MIRRGGAILLALMISLSITTSLNIIPERKIEVTPLRQQLPCHISFEPFNITSNTDFEIQGWPGNGSISNPYLIKNLNISGSVWVWNTTSHFVIQNCLASSIRLENSSNARVVGNSMQAVSGYNLSQCIIADNWLSSWGTPIMFEMSNYTMIHNNTCTSLCLSGISLVGCRHSTVSLNSFSSMIDGISLWSAYNVSIANNTLDGQSTYMYYPKDGIKIWNGSNCTISGNVIHGFGWSNIAIQGKHHIVEHNSVTSSNFGMNIKGDGHLVEHNDVTSNYYGIFISTNNSDVRNNDLENNFLSIEIVKSNDTKIHSNLIVGEVGYIQKGIVIHGGVDCNIYSNLISQLDFGITLQGATGFRISNNTCLNCRYGFAFSWDGYHDLDVSDGPSFECNITYNSFDRGGLFTSILNHDSWDFSTIRFVGNTVNGGRIGFYAYLDGSVIDGSNFNQILLLSCKSTRILGGRFYDIESDVWDDDYHNPGQASAITLLNCSDCEIVDVNIYQNTIGVNFQYSRRCSLDGVRLYRHTWAAIVIWHTNEVLITNFRIYQNLKGILSGWSWDSRIYRCTIKDNTEGIVLVNSRTFEVLYNTIYNNIDAVFLENSDQCEITGNNIYLNSRGLIVNGSSECLITKNHIFDNTGVGISFDDTSHRNDIYDNTFENNTPNAICIGSSNNWDNQVDTGNWWSDYIGQGPYVIDENDQDNFPNDYVITTTPSTTIEPWEIDPLVLGLSSGVVGIVLIMIIINDRRRVEIVD